MGIPTLISTSTASGASSIDISGTVHAGGALTMDNFSPPIFLRTPGTYTGVTGTSSGTGVVGTFDIVVGGTGAVTSVTVVTGGSGHAVGDTITILDVDIGDAGEPPFQMDVATTRALTVYGIDSTYEEYMFVFTDVNPATDQARFGFQVNAFGESGYNETITSTAFRSAHGEDDTTYFNYETSEDQAQGTALQSVVQYIGNGSDECAAGVLHLFSPMSTFIGFPHFYARSISYWHNNKAGELYTAGYIDTTSVINEISFKMGSGNFDGVIQMYGIK
jgi:hypothetical protein